MKSYHTPVLLQASIKGMNIQQNGVYVDLTFGGGGHSREILARLSKNGKLIVFDTDEDAKNNLPEDNRVIFFQSNYRYFINFLEYNDLLPVHGILADLGIASHHIDVPERGFSYRFDAVLDMRMNKKAETTAAMLINNYSLKKLNEIFDSYGELGPTGKKIAKAIVEQREHNFINTTFELNAIVEKALNGYLYNKVLSKLYQALRIEVNQELTALTEMLATVPNALALGGRICIITYHSLEDRIVKKYFKRGCVTDSMKAIQKKHKLVPVNKKVIVPDLLEVKQNRRARSAKLRIAEKIADHTDESLI